MWSKSARPLKLPDRRPAIETLSRLRLSARVALVTGANRGLGFETARQLLANGLAVVLAGRDAAGLERARRALPEPDQRRAFTVQMDVTHVESVNAAQRAVTEQVRCVNVLVNTAAVLLGENDDLLSISADDYRRTFETNLFGVIAVCRAFVPALARDRYGRVVNVSSGAGQLATGSVARGRAGSAVVLRIWVQISRHA